MTKKIKMISVVFLTIAVSFQITGQESESADTIKPVAESEPESSVPSVDLAVDAATDYIWRGIDFYAGKFAVDEKDEGAFNMATSLMPSITFYAPVEGVSFNIWMAWAPLAREAEDGGLKYADEVDFTASYEFENKAGSFSSAFILYAYPMGSLASYSEIVFGYSAPVIFGPSISVAAADGIGGSTLFYSFGISHSIESGAISIEPGLSYNYWYFNDEQARSAIDGLLSYIDFSLPVSYAVSDKFSVGLSASFIYKMFAKDEDKTISIIDSSEIDKQKIKAAITLSAAYSF
ncbi:MAG: hypothetical protein OEZ22_08430 [Spirochaetia bacterium]|nr:hypothetical protein [Spirochaetia bacterium]